MKKLIAIFTSLLVAFTVYAFPPTPPTVNISGNAGTVTGLTIPSNSTLTVSNAVNATITANPGTMAYQAANAVNVTGGNVTGLTNLGAANLAVSGVANVTGATWQGLTSASVSGLGTIATQNADAVAITAGNVTGLTSLSAATANVDHIAEKTGSHGVVFDNNLDIGSTTAGKNVNVYATLGAEMAPALEAANWTATDGWSAGSGVLTKVAGTGTGTATPSGTFTVTAGVTYKVVMVVSAAANSPTYTLGGVTGTTLTATTITDYITAATTGKIIFSGGASATCTITSLTVKALTDATGDLTVEGNIVVRSPILLPFSAAAYPAVSFRTAQTTGIYGTGTTVGIATAGISSTTFNTGGIRTNSLNIGSNDDLLISYDASNTWAQRNGTTQQTARFYNTYTNSSNYERLSLTGVQGASVNITAETAGTGGDNLDVVITPAGTGLLKNAASVITSGSGTGVTVNHTGAVIQQVYKVTTTYAAYSDSDLTKGIVIATLPAKTRLVAAYADTTVAYAGTDITAATLEVGVTAEGAAEIIAVHNVFAGAVTKGLADADMGTGMTRAAQIQGAYTPSFTGTTAVYATIDATTGAATTLANLTAGSTTFYLITERLP